VNLDHSVHEDHPAVVMVVEDEFWIRLTLADALRGAGHHVLKCSSADDALAYLHHGSAVDLICTDVRMPG
jgi:CheY-like chemotaxis protein